MTKKFAPSSLPKGTATNIETATIRRRGVKWAPVCFGNPFLFEPDSEACRHCVFAERCGKVAAVQAARLTPGRPLPAPYVGHYMMGPSDPLWRTSYRHHARERHLRNSNNSRRLGIVKDEGYRRGTRADPAITAIENDYRARLRALKIAVAARWRSKLLQQLTGRELEIAKGWKARSLAQLTHGAAVSDEDVALTHRGMSGGSPDYTAGQARSCQRMIAQLEEDQKAWGKYKRFDP